jgi:uncharacterized protein (TIGR03083 family)
MSHPSLTGLDLCWSSLNSLLDDLTDDQWSTQSLCPDWDVAGVVMHLVAVEEMLLGRAPSEFAERLPFEEVAGFTDAMASLSRAELTEKFASVTAARKTELAELSDGDFATPVMTPVGPGTYGRFMDIRVFDFWVHEQDIRTPLNLPGHEVGVAAERSIDEIRMSMPYIAGKRVGVPDGSSLRVQLTGPIAGEITVRVDGRAGLVDDADETTATITADSTTFALLACGRVDPQSRIDSGKITWSGDVALGEKAARNLRFTM